MVNDPKGQSGQTTRVSLSISGYDRQITISMDFAAGFDQLSLPDHLQSTGMPVLVCHIADDLCKAWNARWILDRAQIVTKDSKFQLWKAHSLEALVRSHMYDRPGCF